MKKVFTSLVFLQISLLQYSQIIADHTVVDKFDDIPQYYIDLVKQMRVSYPGESHARWVQYGMAALETLDSRYQVNVTTTGSPEGATSSRLRMDYFMWGNVRDADSWYVSYGEEDWWANTTAISRTKAGLSYMNSNGSKVDAVGFGWCWDEISRGNNVSTIDPVSGAYWGGFYYDINNNPVDLPWGLDDTDNALTGNTINMGDYLEATQQYIDYCASNNIPTVVFFTTPPTNGGWMTGSDYQATLKAQYIRDYVLADQTRILFDYADILAYDDNGIGHTETWSGHTYPVITPTNEGDESEAHIDSPGTLRLAKAMWWMLARISGWDGKVVTGINKLENDESSKILIQKFENEIRIRLDSPSLYNSATLSSLQGKLILNSLIKSDHLVFNISTIPPGIYFIVLSKGRDRLIKKVTIP